MMPVSRSGRPDTAVSSVSGAAESQQHSRPRALFCCGWGHIAKPRKSGYKQLIKRLKMHFRLTVLEDGKQSLGASPMEEYSLLVIACPRRTLGPSDLACAHHFVATGGCLLALGEAGGDSASGSNLSALLAPFSIAVEHSAVLQAVPGGACLHPTTACIGADGVLSKQLAAALEAHVAAQQTLARDSHARPSTALPGPLGCRPPTATSLTPRPQGSPAARPGTPLRAGAPAKTGNSTGSYSGSGERATFGPPAKTGNNTGSYSSSGDAANSGVRLVYVRGATLGVEEPAVPVLATGHTCSPTQLPVGASWSGEGQGRVAVLGSSAAFDDANIGTCCNAALLEWLLAWLQQEVPPETEVHSAAALAAMTYLGGANLSSDIFALSERLRLCFPQELELPADWTLLLDRTIYWPTAQTL